MKLMTQCAITLLTVASLLAGHAGAQTIPYTTINVGNGPEIPSADTVNGKVYVPNNASNTVSVIDAATWTKITDVATGGGPRRIRFDTALNKLYVNNSTGNSVTVINMVTNAVITTINLPASSNPWNTGYNPTTKRLYVALRNTNQLAVIDTTTDTVVTYVNTGSSPRAACVNLTTNRIYVPNFSSNNVTVVDGSNNTEVAGSPVAVGTGPAGCGIDEATNRIFVSNDTSGSFSTINGATNTASAPVPTGLNASVHTLNGDANLLVIGNFNSGTVSLFRLDTLAPIGTITTGANPWSSLIDPVFHVLYVTNRGSNTVSVIDLHDYVVKQQIPVGTAPQGLARYFQNVYVANQNNGQAGSSLSVIPRVDFRHSWDLENDGRSDVVLRNSGTKETWAVSMLFAATSKLLGASDWVPVVRYDFDGDGKSDIVWRNTATTETAFWFMDGHVAKAVGIIWPASTYEPLDSVGCAGTASRCILWRDSVTGNVAYWYMSNGLAPTLAQLIYTGGPGWTPVLTRANFNGDAHGDLVWQHTDGRVAIWLMQGDETAGFSAKAADIVWGPGTGWVPEFVGDFDGDARSDILWHHATTGDTAIWLMNGTKMKSGATILPGALGWTVTHVRDLDGDQKSDLIWRHTSGATAGWLMNGLVSKPGGAAILLDSASANWMVTHTLDTNGDAKGDLIWRNSVTGHGALWIMDGLTLTSAPGFFGLPWSVVPSE